MKTKITAIFITLFFLIVFSIFYKGLQNSNIYIPTLNTEKEIPSFKATLFNSMKEINSDEIFKNDKFYIMNIWASWCIPCRDEHVFLLDLSKEKKIEIIGLNYKDKKKNAQNFLKEFKSPYEIIFSDDDGLIAIEWGAYGVPETFFIYDKKIIKKIIGPINKDSLAEIKSLIK